MSEEEKIRIPGREGEELKEVGLKEAFKLVRADPDRQQMIRIAREKRISDEDLTKLLTEFDRRIAYYEGRRGTPEEIITEAKLALDREEMTPEARRKVKEAMERYEEKWWMLAERDKLHHRIEEVAAARENMKYFKTWKDPRWRRIADWIEANELREPEMRKFVSLCDEVDKKRAELRERAAENDEIRAMRRILADLDRKREHYKDYLHTWAYQGAHKMVDQLIEKARAPGVSVEEMIEYEELADFALRELEMREKMKVVHLIIDDSRSSEEVLGVAHRFSADDLNALFDMPGFSEGFSMFEKVADEYVYAPGPERYKIEEQMARDLEAEVLLKYPKATGFDGKTIVRMVFDFAWLSGRMTRYDRYAAQIGDLPMDWMRRIYHTRQWVMRYKKHLPAELLDAITCGINDFFSWSWRPGDVDKADPSVGRKANPYFDYISGEGKFGMNFSLVKMLNYRALKEEFERQGLSGEEIERRMGEIDYSEIGKLKDDQFKKFKEDHGLREDFEWIKGISWEERVEDLPERYRDGDKLKPLFFGFDKDWKSYKRFTQPIVARPDWGLEHHDFNLTGNDVFQRFWRDTDAAYREVLPLILNFVNNPTAENYFKLGNFNIWRTFDECYEIYGGYADALMGYMDDPTKFGPIARDQIPFLGGLADRVNLTGWPIVGPIFEKVPILRNIKVSGGWRDSRRPQWTAKEDWLFLMNCMEHRRINPKQFEELMAKRIGGKLLGKLPLWRLKGILGEATAKLDAFLEGDFQTTIIYALLTILIKKFAEEEE